GEPSGTLPPLLADASWERRLTLWGGTLTLTNDIEGHWRDTSILNTASGVIVDDAVRLGFGAGWQGSRALDSGLVIETGAGVGLDYYGFSADSAAEDTLRGTAYAQTTLRYPMIRRSAQAVHIIEPVVQLAWSDTSGGAIPNEDSTAIEFDQSSLLALSRFSGEDAVETGLRGTVGLTWTRLGAGGWDSTLSLGRVLRADADLAFSPTSGLDTTLSDWLIAGQLRLPSGFALDSRLIIDDALGINKSETRVAWGSDKLDLTASYIFLPADPFENRPNDVSEWTVDSTYRINDIWSLRLDARYDVAADEPSRAGLEIGWQNECVAVDFSVSHRFTTSTTLTPSTDYGLSIELNGFGAGRSLGRPSNRCTD
ncbi:MAG: LPS-assembly protein LptD, partial [Octadecabacter sp.]|nr:LPS-assembly protein LptD [Octadecabacter sp.]